MENETIYILKLSVRKYITLEETKRDLACIFKFLSTGLRLMRKTWDLAGDLVVSPIRGVSTQKVTDSP
jgi:hypothetical protein